MWISILVAAIIAGLLTLVEHWAPWRAWLGAELKRTTAYILGTLAIILPLTGLLATWGDWQAIAALWVVVVFAGLGTIGGYAIDSWNELQIRARIAEKEAQVLRPGVNDDQEAR